MPLLILFLTLATSLSVGQQTKPESQPPDPQGQKQTNAQAQTVTPEKVGNETCLGCHDIAATFSHSPHADQECESCHGPGSVHVETGGEDKSVSFKVRPPKWANSQCLACHTKDREVSAFHKGPHGRNGLSCVSCHNAHPEKPRFNLLKAAEASLCISCHNESRGDFQKPYHHPVLENAMDCTDCHTPHSEERRPMQQLTFGSEQSCISCHSDKGGPFVFEHVPVRVNNCQTCHEPHGSTNARMLIRNEVHLMCLECHSMTPGVLTSQPPAFHNINSPRFRECTTCHREIHGSNADRVFLK